jgi:cytochrome bd ubiquinol oxidase subunit II
MTSVELVWGIMGAGVVAYALTGGADFGGGIWHLLARGPNAERQRRAIERAIAPIWEANHVWLIFVIVLMFTAFPVAFSAISTALHVPLSLALVGIVVRGSAFVFHAYDLRDVPRRRGFALAFGLSSLLTPLVLGDVLGALSTGEIRWDGSQVTSGLTSGWTAPFALANGVFAAALFALLAAVYLTVEAEPTPDLADDFRRRALVLELVAGACALGVLLLARSGAPVLYENLARSSWTVPIQGATAAAALGTILALITRRYGLARFTAATQVALVVVGWGLAMRGAIVLPDLTLRNAGARHEVLDTLLVVLALGGALLAPALWYLLRVFKTS